MEPEREPERASIAEHRRADGRRGDRVWVHLAWEGVLLVAVVVAALAVRSEDASVFRGLGLRDLSVMLAAGVLLGTAFAVSLRAAVPNLAVGAAAVTAGTLTGWLVGQRGYELRTATLVTLGAAVALGLALAAVVVGLRAPAWAAGLAAALGLYAAALSLGAGRTLPIPGAPDLRRWAWPLLAAAVVVSVGAGLLGMRREVRHAVGRYRPTGDPAAGRGGGAGLVATTALVASTVLAAGAGLVLAFRAGAAVPDDGLTLLAQAAGAALLGGTSAHGRRGGIFGTVLAAAFLYLAAVWLGLVEAEPWTRQALLGGAILVGLLVSRVVEAAGESADDVREPDEDRDERDPYATEAWSPYSTSTYSTAGYAPGTAAPGDQGTYRTDEPWWPGQAPPGSGPPFRSGSDS